MPESTNPLSSFVVPNSDQTHYTPTTAEPLDLDALEVVANAATAGPWWTGVGLGSFQYTVEGPDADSHPVAQRLIHPDATHVANFDPPTVLALIAALKEARERLDLIAAEYAIYDNARSGQPGLDLNDVARFVNAVRTLTYRSEAS